MTPNQGVPSEADSAASHARVRELAAVVLTQLATLSDAPLTYDRASVVWLEGYIERERMGRDPAAGAPAELVDGLGAFLGECILASADGQWVWDEFQNDWCLALTVGGRISPAGKIWRQFMHGRDGGESIVAFYDIVVDYLAKGKLPGVGG